jgi:tRNA (mo5U34)-methyltransferase
MHQREIESRVRALGDWFHNLDLAGVKTAPSHFLGDYPASKWRRFEHAIPRDLRNKSVLDIGCNAGFHAIEMKRRGAERVVGIDTDERYLAQARLAIEVCGVDVALRSMSIYDVGELRERFDVVLFMGVLDQLRYPLLALDLLHEHVAGDMLVFQTRMQGSEQAPNVKADPFKEERVFDDPGYPKMHFVEKRYAGHPKSWWIPNRASAAAMVRSAGFDIVDHPEVEVFICKRRNGMRQPGGEVS